MDSLMKEAELNREREGKKEKEKRHKKGREKDRKWETDRDRGKTDTLSRQTEIEKYVVQPANGCAHCIRWLKYAFSCFFVIFLLLHFFTIFTYNNGAKRGIQTGNK